MVEENARDVPAWSSRTATARQTIATALEKRQSALQRAGSIAPPLGPPRRAEFEHWDEDVRCPSVDPVLSGCVVYMSRVLESITGLAHLM